MLYLREKMGVAVESLAGVLTDRDHRATRRRRSDRSRAWSSSRRRSTPTPPPARPPAPRRPAFLQRGFASLEAAGKVYRLDGAAAPTKFMDATLNGRGSACSRVRALRRPPRPPRVHRRQRRADVCRRLDVRTAVGRRRGDDDVVLHRRRLRLPRERGRRSGRSGRPTASGSRCRRSSSSRLLLQWRDRVARVPAVARVQKNARCEQPLPGGGDAAAAPTPSGLLGALGRGHAPRLAAQPAPLVRHAGDGRVAARPPPLLAHDERLHARRGRRHRGHDGLVAAGIENE